MVCARPRQQVVDVENPDAIGVMLNALITDFESYDQARTSLLTKRRSLAARRGTIPV